MVHLYFYQFMTLSAFISVFIVVKNGADVSNTCILVKLMEIGYHII